MHEFDTKGKLTHWNSKCFLLSQAINWKYGITEKVRPYLKIMEARFVLQIRMSSVDLLLQ